MEGLEPKWFTARVTISLSPPFLILAGLGILDSPLMNTILLATNERARPKMSNSIIIVHNLRNYIIVEKPARRRKAKARSIICNHIIQH